MGRILGFGRWRKVRSGFISTTRAFIPDINPIIPNTFFINAPDISIIPVPVPFIPAWISPSCYFWYARAYPAFLPAEPQKEPPSPRIPRRRKPRMRMMRMMMGMMEMMMGVMEMMEKSCWEGCGGWVVGMNPLGNHGDNSRTRTHWSYPHS